ncbi:unnamed protein product [Rangifer tarandus platyrhynchus]|uniref:Uncharacterized protein n=2 Tax=Rangifer tarandus platyrhynchus TaxID=3082113 RepID=A0ACB0F287_RANTA|nr:unnamed protein product [Rangifer tarandus platyrhynchus]CAI9707002.1 unnamed protein product [Rangifer tarandus platyrhynchus]
MNWFPDAHLKRAREPRLPKACAQSSCPEQEGPPNEKPGSATGEEPCVAVETQRSPSTGPAFSASVVDTAGPSLHPDGGDDSLKGGSRDRDLYGSGP